MPCGSRSGALISAGLAALHRRFPPRRRRAPPRADRATPRRALGPGLVSLSAALFPPLPLGSREQGWPRQCRALHGAGLVLRGVRLQGVGRWGRRAWRQPTAPPLPSLGPAADFRFVPAHGLSGPLCLSAGPRPSRLPGAGSVKELGRGFGLCATFSFRFEPSAVVRFRV